MLAIIALLCLYILLLFAITLATIVYLLCKFAIQLLKHTLHTRDHPHKHNSSGWAEHGSDPESYSSLPTGNGHFRPSDPDPSKSKPIGIFTERSTSPPMRFDEICAVLDSRDEDTPLWHALAHFYDNYHLDSFEELLFPHETVNGLLSVHLSLYSNPPMDNWSRSPARSLQTFSEVEYSGDSSPGSSATIPRRSRNPLRQAPLLSSDHVRVNHARLQGPHALVPRLRLNDDSVLGAIQTWRTYRQLPQWLVARSDKTPMLAALRHHFPLLAMPAKKKLTWVTPHRHYQFRCQARIQVPMAPHSQIEPIFWYLLRCQTLPWRPHPYNAGFAWAMDMTTSHAPTGSVQAVVSAPPVTLLIRAQTLDVHAPGTLGPLFTSTTIQD
ncbi:hypothetical protein C8Q76DRAFT_688628 [Earliella scabrosa]|nr:hypothetical protein C8Q76DRAFT_688628 [Earliella scabrosa]